MKQLVCTIFNVEHGFCAFVKSPNDYGLLIDFGSRANFSPVKWVRAHYNSGNDNITHWKAKRIAMAIVTHPHADHVSDVGSLTKKDEPVTLRRDKTTVKLLKKKIEADADTDLRRVDILRKFVAFQSKFTEDVKESPDWGFDLFKSRQITYKAATDVSEDPDKIINNRSYVTVIGYAGKKILLPGDIEVDAWLKFLDKSSNSTLVAGTTFFVASHHGHKSGFSKAILDHTGKPKLFIVSAKSGDKDVDSAYSDSKNSEGYTVSGDKDKSHMISTRERKRSIQLTITEDGTTNIQLLKADDNLKDAQASKRDKRTERMMKKWS